MTISLATPVMSAGIGKPSSVVAYAQRNGAMRLGEVKNYVDTIYDLAPKVGLNPDILIAQSDEETDHWTSDWWVDRLNPAGIGITGDPAQNAASGEWASGTDAAKAQIVHMLAYARGSIPAIAEPWLKYDPRYQAVFQAKLDNTVTLIDDLGGGTWAADPRYAEKIVQHYQAIFGEDTPVTGKPTIVITAGHRSDNDFGNPNEKDRTDDMARAYRDVFTAAGFATHYLQNEDGDNRPDITTGGLDTVGQKTRALMLSISGPEVLFDCHFEGASARGVFAIVPDEDGLTTAVIGGAPGDDLWENNPLDVSLARAISKKIAAATGLPLRQTTEPGVMSETQTGVGGQGYRLAMFAYTVPVRDRAVRLVVEHGSIPTADITIINSPGFYAKCAKAALDAVNEVYKLTDTPTTPAPKPPSIYPKGMSKQLAARLYGSLTVPWTDEPFVFDPASPEGKEWLRRGKASMTGATYDTGVWPEISDAIRRGDGSTVLTYSDGSTIPIK
jgi:N-acetylmuramoyl-L-alanine amidase